MFQNPLTGWSHPLQPKVKSHEVAFTITFLYGHLYRWLVLSATTMKVVMVYRYFEPGIEYNIAGYRRDEDGEHQVMLTDSRVMTLDNPEQWSIRCEVVSNSWAGEHTPEYDLNSRNAKSRRNAIKAGERAYGFYTSEEKDAEPAYYVAVRPARNQPNGINKQSADTASLHAALQRPTPADMDGKPDFAHEKHPLTDPRLYQKPKTYHIQNDATRL